MADNIVLNAGAGGATLGSDEVTIGAVLQQVQRVKLVDGSDGGTGLIGGDAANGLDVDVTRVGGNVSVIGPAADGAALSGAPVRVAGSDGTLVQDISVTSAGHVQIQDGGNSITVDNGGTFAVQATEADGANTTLGAKADAKSTATDTTAITAMSVWKQISSSVQAIATSVAGTLTVAAHNVTNAGTFAVQATEADGANVTLGAKADAKSTATDATAITAMSVWKQISASVQAIATSVAGTLTVGTHAVTQSGTWTVQPGNTANTTAWKVDGSAVTQPVDSELTTADLDTGAGTDTRAVVGLAGAASGGAVLVQATSGGALKGDLTTIAGTAPTTVGKLDVKGADGDVFVRQATAANLNATAAQGGTWTVQPGNTANTTAWKVDGSAVTQPVSGTVSVNTHDVANITTSVTPGTGAANLGKAEDAAHTSGDTGVMAFAVRRDADTSLVDTTGDYAPLQVNAAGSLKVAITAGAGSGGTSLADNAGFTPGTTSFTPIGGEVDDVASTDATENSAGIVRMTVKRAIHVNLRDASGTELSVGGGTQYTEDAVSVADPVVTMGGARRRDTLSTTEVSADGDVIALNATNKGQLHAKLADVDATVGAGSAPANQVVVGAVYNTSAPAPTNGQAMAQQADQAGNKLVAPGIATATLAGWTSATALNATQTIFTKSGVQAVLLHLVQTSTLTVGAVTVEVSYDGTNFVTISSDCVIDPTSATLATVGLPYTLQASTNKALLLLVKGAQALRLKLSTAITGTATVTPNYALLPYAAVQQAVLGAGTATIGALTANQSTNTVQLGGTAIALNTGARSAGTQRVTIATDDVVPVSDNSGSLTVDAPVGTPAFVRLSDGAAAITTLPVSLATLPSGAVTNAGTFAVQAMPAVAASATLTNVGGSASSVSLLASTAGRRGALFYNDSNEALYLKFGATASTTSFTVKVLAGGYYELPTPIYTGAIDGIWSAANGNVRITELA